MNVRMRKPLATMLICFVCVGLGFTPAAAEGTWETTLQGRDLDGDSSTTEAYYDTALNITWLADANFAKTTGYDADGLMTWSAAKAWAAGLSLGGSTRWRLPVVRPVDGVAADDANISNIGTEDWGYNISAPGTLYAGSTASEMAHLFFQTLGNTSVCDPGTSSDSSCVPPMERTRSPGPFVNYPRENSYFWSATSYAPKNSFEAAWVFFFSDGLQLIYPKEREFYALAVHPGDVGRRVSTTVKP